MNVVFNINLYEHPLNTDEDGMNHGNWKFNIYQGEKFDIDRINI